MPQNKVQIMFKFSPNPLWIELDRDKALELIGTLIGVEGDSIYAADVPVESPSTSEPLVSLSAPAITETSELITYIKSKYNYNFSVEEITDKFLDQSYKLEPSERSRWINGLRTKLSRIRDRISLEENGTWVQKREGSVKTYTFVKS